MNTTAQAHEVTYELHTLGWKAFQDLCISIAGEVLGQTVEAYLPTHDGGRDGAFTGSWSDLKEGGVKGTFTIQCKFSSDASKSLHLSDLADEIEKAERLASKGLATNYVLMTNCGLSGTAAEDIKDAFQKIDNLEWFGSFGKTWITLKIRESPRLRMIVPRVYGLGDLSQILDERAQAQAEEILDSIGDDLTKFVITDAHRQSVEAILSHGFVLLLGEPASGKSMIAATLAIGAIDVWNCSTVKIQDAADFVRHWNPHEPRRFFWVDDVFGTTQYQRATVLEWNKTFPHLHAAIKKGARVIFTSRDYIFKAATEDIKTSAFPLLADSQVIINVETLTQDEKQQILYNHIKLGDQTPEYKAQIKPFLEDVADSRHFLPEIARRLGNSLFTKHLTLIKQHVRQFVEDPLDFLVEVVESLDTHLKAALSILFMNGGRIVSPIRMSSEEKQALDLLGSTVADVRRSLGALSGSLVKFVGGSTNEWIYKHPTIGDAMAEVVARDAELLDIYLKGTRPEKLVHEIVCGDVEIQGAKVRVPASRYENVLNKLSRIDSRFLLHIFLAHRVDKAFLKRFLSHHEGLPEDLISGSFGYWSSEVALLSRLHELGILAEDIRLSLLEAVQDAAVEVPEADFLMNRRFRALFTDAEIQDSLNRVRSELIPDLAGVVQRWSSEFDETDDAESYFEPLKDALSTFSSEFSEDDDIASAINSAITQISEEVEELEAAKEEESEDYEDLSSSSSSGPTDSDRSIFDDVDE